MNNNRLPVAPIFLFDDSREWVEFTKAVSTTQKASRFYLSKQSELIGYDAELMLWSGKYALPRGSTSMWTRFLANTVYNPLIDVPIRWHEIRKYSIEELRDRFIVAVEHDDDRLTQFVDRDELIQRLNDCSTFDQFMAAWEWLSHE